MKRIFYKLIAVIIFFPLNGYNQAHQFTYYFDANLARTSETNAFLIGKGSASDGFLKVDFFYRDTDKMLMSINYTDSSLANMSGPFTSYYNNGKTENDGVYKNNIEEGTWIKWDSAGRKTDSIVYQGGKKIVRASYTYGLKGNLINYSLLDSINAREKTIFYRNDKVSHEINFVRDSGILEIYENGGLKKIPITKKDLVEASFKNGDKDFRQFLVSNLDVSVAVDSGAPTGQYPVIIRFVIAPDGTISDIEPETNYGYGTEQEAIRVLRRCPKWNPASIAGYPLNAYRRMPVTFVVDNGDSKNK